MYVLVLFIVGSVTCGRVHQSYDYYNDRGDQRGEARINRSFEQRQVPPDSHTNVPYYGRFVEANRPTYENRYPVVITRSFVENSNEITDGNIDRIKTNIYSNIQQQTEQNYGRNQNNQDNFRKRNSENKQSQNRQTPPPNTNAFRTNVNNDRRQQEAYTPYTPDTIDARRAHEAITTQTNKKPFTNKIKADGTAVEEESSWVWGTSDDNQETTTPDDLDNRAAFSGDNCPTGKVKVLGKCVESH